jgi:23S rRNA pseudouridine955/2504/2580 synthase
VAFLLQMIQNTQNTHSIQNLNASANTLYNADALAERTISAQVRLVVVTVADDGQRLDNFLAKSLKGAPRSHIQRIIRSGEVRINGARAAFDTRVVLGQTVRIPPVRLAARVEQALDNKFNAAATPSNSTKKPIPFPVLFEDEHILVINKPSGVAVHGGSGVAFGVIEQLRQCGVSPFLELAHRIDRDTSGILVIAKRRPALVKLQEQLRDSVWKKNYLCVVAGVPDFSQQDVKLPLLRSETTDGERRVVVDEINGQFALSRLRVLRKTTVFAELQVRILTGRTHQIRVHCAALGLPLLGDEKYGNYELNKSLKKRGLKRLMLHATRLELPHPISGEMMMLEAVPPQDYTGFVSVNF